MNKETFVRGIVQMVMPGVSLNVFEGQGFFTLNGETAQKLRLSFSREPICKFVTDAANQMKDSLKNGLKEKLILLKWAAQQDSSRSFLGINVGITTKEKNKQR